MIKANIEKVGINTIFENPANPRSINKQKFKKLVNSVKGFPEMLSLRPIVVNGDMVILGGNMRYKACKEIGLKEVYIIQAADLTDKQAEEFIIKDNVGFGDWDWDVKELEEWGLEGFPFEDEVLEAEEDDYTEPDNINVDVVLGDLIEIGEHRLLCGDSTDSDQVAKLMDGEKADMVFTSPPYNANTQMDGVSLYENNTDNKTSKEFIGFLGEVLNNCILNTDGFIFWNIGYNAKSRMEWIENTYNFKDYLQETIIWKKSSVMPIQYGFTRIVEFIFLYNTKGFNNYINNKGDIVYNFWEISNNNSSIDNHKACFPIELPFKAISINDNSKLILEPFTGSGTTMVAAHQLKRKCYGMELDPKYCQVIIDRMYKLDSSLKIKINGKEYTPTI